MTTLHRLSIAAALLSAATPWFVVLIALEVARRHARLFDGAFPTPPGVARLGALTLVGCAATTGAAFVLEPPSLVLGAIEVLCFLVLAVAGLRVLGAVHEASRPAREVATNTRSASLRPRRLNDHVRVIWRLVPVTITVASLATFAWRLSVPGPDRRLLLPAAFALAAPVFIWLYEVWMREEVSGGSADGDPSREASRLTKVRLIFAAELTLVLWLTLAGHALLDLDWAAPRPWAGVVVVTSAVLGIAGCALAVSSDLARRRYAPHDPRSSFPPVISSRCTPSPGRPGPPPLRPDTGGASP